MSDILSNPRLHVVDHPLVQHKLYVLRDKNTTTKDFRTLVTELAVLEGYEATRDLPLEDVEVTTPLETFTAKRISGKKLAIIPILRAGLGETHEPVQYYCKFPDDIESRICLIVDPMLATGGSLTACIQYLREAGVRDIRALTLVSCPEGVQAVLDYDPDVQLYTCAVDRQLNDDAYIVPGLGDAGDRIYGTK